MSFEISGFQHTNDIRGSVQFLQDGSGFRPVTPNDFANINITGAQITVSVHEIGLSGGYIDSISNIDAGQVSISGNGLLLDVVSVSGNNSIPVFIKSGVEIVNYPTGIGITNFPTSFEISNQLPQVGISGGSVSVSNFPVEFGISGKVNIQQSTTTTRSGVAASASPVTVFAINLNRKGLGFYNKASTAAFFAYGENVTTNDFSLIVPVSGYYEMPTSYSTDAVSVVWEGSPVGSGFFTELS